MGATVQTELEMRLYATLRRIAKGYQTPDQLRRRSEKDWGVGYEEALEMAYENLQQEAANAIHGLRLRKSPAQREGA